MSNSREETKSRTTWSLMVVKPKLTVWSSIMEGASVGMENSKMRIRTSAPFSRKLDDQ